MSIRKIKRSISVSKVKLYKLHFNYNSRQFKQVTQIVFYMGRKHG